MKCWSTRRRAPAGWVRKVDPKNTSRLCRECGTVKSDLTLGDRVMVCYGCHHTDGPGFERSDICFLERPGLFVGRDARYVRIRSNRRSAQDCRAHGTVWQLIYLNLPDREVERPARLKFVSRKIPFDIMAVERKMSGMDAAGMSRIHTIFRTIRA